MAAVNNKFKEYRIKENDIEAVVVPELGGMLTEFKVRGKDILYLDRSLLKKGDIHGGGFPVLFPVCGSLKGGVYKVDDEVYPMPKHGFARNGVWSLKNSQLSGSSITLMFSASDETRVYYPFDFKVFLTYRLSGGALIIKQEVRNNSERAMPFCSGYHPFFTASDKPSIEFDINAGKFLNYNKNQVEKFKSIDFGEPVDHVFFNFTSNTHGYINKKDGYSLKMTLDKKMTALVLWTMEGKNFICLEPWMAKPDAMNTGENVCRVDPGSSTSVEMGIEIAVF